MFKSKKNPHKKWRRLVRKTPLQPSGEMAEENTAEEETAAAEKNAAVEETSVVDENAAVEEAVDSERLAAADEAVDSEKMTASEEAPFELREAPVKGEDAPTEPEEVPAEPEDSPVVTEDAPAEPEAAPAAAEDAPIEAEEAPFAVEENPAAETAAADIESEPEEVPADVEEASAEPEGSPAGPETSSAEEETADRFERVLDYFREICAIPHGSFHTDALSDYLEQFAKERQLACVRDESGNLIICRPASAGNEDAAPVALQAHIDMVCEKESSSPVNMETDPITLIMDGEWLHADKTTLGGDDGIGVAMMLAILSDNSVKCPPLECIFTVDEEVGLLGAAALDLSGLRSRRLINIDSEEEGVITAACAGGAEEICTLAGHRREKKGQVLEIVISGLRGGHSGECIGMGRANADLLMARLLYRLEKTGKYSLISLNGGNRNNAIPREARAEIIFTGKIRRGEVKEAIEEFSRDIRREYSVTDPEIRIRSKWTDGRLPDQEKKERRIAFTRKDTLAMVRFLMALPNGVIEFFPQYPDIPQTSLSLGIVRTMADGIRTHTLVRSNINSQQQMLIDRITCIADTFGASVETTGVYPAWELIRQSGFRDLAADVYTKVTGRKIEVSVTHGGLECGLLTAKVPGLDCISIGPDLEGIHTPAERLSIPSGRRVYTWLRELLSACV